MNKKITIISDTHGKHEHLTSNRMGNSLGSGDILIHCGDISNVGKTHEIKSFLDWFSNTPFTHKIFIAGNHDFGFELVDYIAPEYIEKGVTYLFDSSIEIDGIKFYGSPWQPEFYNWAFNLPRGEKLAEKWAKIPGDTDVLITHGPAYRMLDHTIQGELVGDEDLFNRIMEVKPKLHCCGHIHWAYGQKSFNDIEFINAAVLNERYEHENKPVKLTFDTETKQIEYDL
jgi:Icc-related predicted phosphoesterase